MPTTYSGGGDPARTLALLWGARDAPSRGPKPGLSVERIVAAAIELADAEGFEALSMRRVAERLGVGTMSLYTYVPAKAELLDLMLDAATAEVAAGDLPEGWRAALEQLARESWALYHRHPWMLEVTTVRPVLGPGTIGRYERDLRSIDGAGLTDLEMDAITTLVEGHVEGCARRSVEIAQAERRTGLTEEQWWEARAPVLAEVLDPERYPTAVRVGAAAGEEHGAAYAPEHAFEFGLQRILDGIEVLIARRRT